MRSAPRDSPCCDVTFRFVNRGLMGHHLAEARKEIRKDFARPLHRCDKSPRGRSSWEVTRTVAGRLRYWQPTNLDWLSGFSCSPTRYIRRSDLRSCAPNTFPIL